MVQLMAVVNGFPVEEAEMYQIREVCTRLGLQVGRWQWGPL